MKRILIIDDEEMPTQLYKMALEKAGFHVEVAETTDHAVKQLQNNGRFHLIILDCMMPPGSLLKNKNTEDGMRTGIVLWEEIKDLSVSAVKMFLTNVRTPSLLQEMWELAGSGRVRQKGRTLPSSLVQEVQSLLA